MLWLIVAIISYLIFAIVSLVDKYLLSKAIPEPGVYAFYIGILSLLILFLVPFFGFYTPAPLQIMVSLLSGASFILAVFWFFRGVKNYETSRIVTATGGLVPIFTFFLILVFSGGREVMSFSEIFSFVLLTAGSVLITLEKKINWQSLKISSIAALFFAASFVLSKYAFLGQPFWNALFWIKIGGGITALFFLFSQKFRERIFKSSHKIEKKTFGVFLAGQSAGASANLLQNWAVALVPLSYVAIINALQGVQYVFLLVIASIISILFPVWSKNRGLKEKISIKIILQKTAAIALIIIGLIILFIPKPDNARNISWGINFSQKYSKDLGLDWKENYLALLNDLGARKIKIAVHWDTIEPEGDRFYWEDLDWQIGEAQKKDGQVILVIGIKTSRWPECHVPDWAKKLNKDDQQKEIIRELEEIIKRYGVENYKNTIIAWQVENEPLFPFGECQWTDEEFLKKEVALIRNLDPQKRPVIISDSGEFSTGFAAAKIGDILGVTMYRRTWVKPLGIYVTYPIPPDFYRFKAWVVKKFFNKDTIVIELQAEPWGRVPLYELPLEEQKKIMTSEIFKENIEYAKKTGFNEFFLWGPEWWYWMKEKQNDPSFWNEAKRLF